MLIGYLLIALAAAELILGLWLIFGYRRQPATMWYGLFAVGAASYVMSNGLGFLGIGEPNYTEKVGWAGGAFLTAMFLAFSYSFPIARKRTSALLPLVLWPVIVFVPTILFTTLLIGFSDNQTFNYRTGYSTATGPYFWTFLLYFSVYWIWSVYNLVTRMLASDGIHRWQIRNILIGIAASLLFSTVFDIVLPLVTVTKFGFVGSLATSFWLGVTSYILLKK